VSPGPGRFLWGKRLPRLWILLAGLCRGSRLPDVWSGM